MYVQVRFCKTRVESVRAILQYISVKKLENNKKNGSFNTVMSREKESNASEGKGDNMMYVEKPFGMKKKPRVNKDQYPLPCQALYHVKMECTMLMFSLKRDTFSLPHSLTNFLPFSLYFSLGSYPNNSAICSSYNPRNVARYKTNVTL